MRRLHRAGRATPTGSGDPLRGLGIRANVISITTPNDMTVGDTDQTMTCTSRGGTSWGASPPLGASYTSSDTNVATIASNKLHAVAAGSVTVTAADTGGTGWGPALSKTSGSVTISSGGGSAPTFLVANGGQTDSVSAGSYTYTLSIPSTMSNGLIDVYVSTFDESGAISSVTFDSQSMSQLGTAHTFSQYSGIKTYGYYLAVGSKASGTYNVTISISSGSGLVSSAIATNGANQTTPHGTPVYADGSDGAASVTVSGTTTNGLLTGMVMASSGDSVAEGTGVSERSDIANTNIRSSGATKAGATTSTAMTWTLTPGSDGFAAYAAEVKAP